MTRAPRLVAAIALLALAAGCRNDMREVRLDVMQVARLVRAYASAAAPPPRSVADLPPERLNDLGVMLERRGMLDRAESHYRMAVERKPDFARAWVNLGNVLRRLKRDDEAADSYRRAVAADPAPFEAVNNFADLCADTGRSTEEALALLAPALDKHPPEESIGRDTLGKLLVRVGRYREAATAFQAAVDLADPREKLLLATMLDHLAQAQRALGDKDAARSAELRAAALRP
jgi:Tfp pilus assembly protein PilF